MYASHNIKESQLQGNPNRYYLHRILLNGNCYELSIPLPHPNSYVEAQTPRGSFGDGDFGKKLGLDEVMEVDPHNRISVLIKRDTKVSLSLPCEDTARRQLSVSQKRILPRNQICLHLDLGFLSL